MKLSQKIIGFSGVIITIIVGINSTTPAWAFLNMFICGFLTILGIGLSGEGASDYEQ